ncbi:MAG: DUF1080 domain-containing protein [Lentisphaeria bacterium]|nr:DUF1080 domain-containing protein [Lentisphaeria bacterium]
MAQIKVISQLIDLDKSELLYDFKTFSPEDWTITRHTPPWQVTPDAIIGGKPDEDKHGQIFFKEPVQGDIVMEFDAELVGNSYHDIVWWWATSLDQQPWGEGYLGCLGGWWNNLAGIEKSPTFEPCCIVPTSPIKRGTRYHIISGSVGTRLFIAVDGVMVVYMTDPNPATVKGGHFGFGVYQSHVRYSNLKVYRPFATGLPVGYKKDSEVYPS